MALIHQKILDSLDEAKLSLVLHGLSIIKKYNIMDKNEDVIVSSVHEQPYVGLMDKSIHICSFRSNATPVPMTDYFLVPYCKVDPSFYVASICDYTLNLPFGSDKSITRDIYTILLDFKSEIHDYSIFNARDSDLARTCYSVCYSAFDLDDKWMFCRRDILEIKG